MVLSHSINSIHFDRIFHVPIIEHPSMVSISAVVLPIPAVISLPLQTLHSNEFLSILGGVTGMPGYNTASIVIDDLKRKKLH